MKYTDLASVFPIFKEYNTAVTAVTSVTKQMLHVSLGTLTLDSDMTTELVEFLGHPVIVPLGEEPSAYVLALAEGDYLHIYRKDAACDLFWYEEWLKAGTSEFEEEPAIPECAPALILEDFLAGFREDVPIRLLGQDIVRNTTLEKLRSTPLWEALRTVDLHDPYAPVEIVPGDGFLELRLI